MNGQYYVHTNGDLIYKTHGGVDASSDFVVQVWNLADIRRTPETYGRFLLEAYRAGAVPERIGELADLQHLFEFMPELEAEFVRLKIPTERTPL